MTSRETAAAIGAARSNGTMRAEGWDRLPLIRMTNVSLLPGEQTLDEVFDTDTASTWRLIAAGRLTISDTISNSVARSPGKSGRPCVRMLKNPAYSGITHRFWNACDAVAIASTGCCGASQLRQGPARAGNGNRTRSLPVAVSKNQNRQCIYKRGLNLNCCPVNVVRN